MPRHPPQYLEEGQTFKVVWAVGLPWQWAHHAWKNKREKLEVTCRQEALSGDLWNFSCCKFNPIMNIAINWTCRWKMGRGPSYKTTRPHSRSKRINAWLLKRNAKPVLNVHWLNPSPGLSVLCHWQSPRLEAQIEALHWTRNDDSQCS